MSQSHWGYGSFSKNWAHHITLLNMWKTMVLESILLNALEALWRLICLATGAYPLASNLGWKQYMPSSTWATQPYHWTIFLHCSINFYNFCLYWVHTLAPLVISWFKWCEKQAFLKMIPLLIPDCYLLISTMKIFVSETNMSDYKMHLNKQPVEFWIKSSTLSMQLYHSTKSSSKHCNSLLILTHILLSGSDCHHHHLHQAHKSHPSYFFQWVLHWWLFDKRLWLTLKAQSFHPCMWQTVYKLVCDLIRCKLDGLCYGSSKNEMLEWHLWQRYSSTSWVPRLCKFTLDHI